MIKFFENKKIGDTRIVSLLSFPLYITENTVDCRTQKFLGGLIYTKRDKSNIKEVKIFKVFNILISERILENDVISYYCNNYLINKIQLVKSFYKKYLKKIKFNYDDVYIFNSNSGEIYLFLAYLAKAFLHKNKSRNPLFIATKKYHADILKIYFPDAKYIFIPKFKLKTKSSYWKYDNHRFFILFSGNYFQNIERDVKEKAVGEAHYLDSMLRALNLTKSDLVHPDAVILPQITDSLSKKVNKLDLKLHNFVILAPEALTCEEISKEFWQKLADKLLEQNIDVYLNIIDKRNYIENCKTADLTFGELYYLAKSSRAVISLRSGLSEFLLPAAVKNIAIYTKFRNRTTYAFPVDKGIEGFSMLKIPFVKKENIRELNYDKFKNNDELLHQVISELESLNVFKSKEECLL